MDLVGKMMENSDIPSFTVTIYFANPWNNDWNSLIMKLIGENSRK